MDTIDKERRSKNMSRIRSKETNPEKRVRKIIRELGFSGYRLHRSELPGKPDIAFIGKKLAVQVHGCFWHSHSCNEGLRRPKSNLDYWTAKLEGNQQRDRRNLKAIQRLGWKVLVVWDCELKETKRLAKRIEKFLS